MGEDMFHKFVEKTKEYRDEDDDNVRDKLKENSFDAYCGYIFIKSSDQAKYGNLINNMNIEFAIGTDKYPKSVTKAVDILANYRPDNAKKAHHKKDNHKWDQQKSEEKKETSFAQTKKDVICYCCGKKGHYAPDCPEKN